MKIDSFQRKNYEKIKQLIISELPLYEQRRDGDYGIAEGLDVEEITHLLTTCSINRIIAQHKDEFDDFYGVMERTYTFQITIICSLTAFQLLENSSERYVAFVAEQVYRRYVLLPDDTKYFGVQVDYELQHNWQNQIVSESTDNQNPYVKKSLNYEYLKFNSPAEIEIAKEFDKRGILYFPNCVARVGNANNRKRTIPDFLVFWDDKWGILEVSGKTYHQDTASDHARTRDIEMHGKIYVTHFDGLECQNNPVQVVDQFLRWLSSR